MVLLSIVVIGTLLVSPSDTTRMTPSGPTIARSRVGVVSIETQAVKSTSVAVPVRGQAKGGLIGAVVGAAFSIGLIELFKDTTDNDPPSLVLAGLGGALAGFVIGVLVAGPD